MNNKTYYFPHDFHAREDEKIINLLAGEDWYGYGLFWAIVEFLYETKGELYADYKNIAFSLRTDSERIKRIIENYGLFTKRGKKFYSRSVSDRLEIINAKSASARESAKKRWDKPNTEYANALPTLSERNAKKVKESKVKESKYNAANAAVVKSLFKSSKRK